MQQVMAWNIILLSLQYVSDVRYLIYWVLCNMCTIIIQCAMVLRVWAVCLQGRSASRDFMQYVYDVGYHSVCYVSESMGCVPPRPVCE